MLLRLLGLKNSEHAKKNSIQSTVGSIQEKNQKPEIIHSENKIEEQVVEIKCPYTEDQALATAKWWLGALELEVPEALTLITESQHKPSQLDVREKSLFIALLVESIWKKCKALENLENIVVHAGSVIVILNMLKIKIENFEKLIAAPFCTTIRGIGTVIFQNGWDNVSTIYNPNNKGCSYKRGEQARKIDEVHLPNNEVIQYRQTISIFYGDKKHKNHVTALPDPLFKNVMSFLGPKKMNVVQVRSEIDRVKTLLNESNVYSRSLKGM